MSKSDESEPQPAPLDVEPPSKSQLKRDAKSVLDLAAALLDARQSDIARLDLPEPVASAIAEGRQINRFGARKRHTQYLAKLLRKEADVEEIRHQLEQPAGRTKPTPDPQEGRHEDMLALLCSDQTEGFRRLRDEYPTLELQRVTRLLRQIRPDEPAQPAHVKACKNLLQLLQSHSG